jgi:hypothetical protein
MSTIRFTRVTSLTPEEHITGLTDFGPRRSKVFSNSADAYLAVHRLRSTVIDVTEGNGGLWERLHYHWSNPSRAALHTTDSNVWSNESNYTYTFPAGPDGRTGVQVVIGRKGETAKGRGLALVLGTVGRGVLKKSFVKSIDPIEARRRGEAPWRYQGRSDHARSKTCREMS